MRRLLLLAAVVVAATAAGATAADTPLGGDPARGERIYETSCAHCHGRDGRGTSQGPTLAETGAAGAHFFLSTGRMPLDEPVRQADRKPPAYDAKEIADLVAYVASISNGPAIPTVDVDAGDLVEGRSLYTANCAACHNSQGSGGALGRTFYAPALTSATPLQVAEAIRVGPGAMPVFGPEAIDQRELDSIARYVEFLKNPEDRGGAPLGRIGPVPEGLAAWTVGLGLLLVFAFWIGTRE